MSQLPTYQRFSKTADSDLVFTVVLQSKWFEFADVFVYNEDAYVGDVNGQDISITANDIYILPEPVDISELFFKNKNAGQNTTIIIAGVEMSERRLRELGLR